MVAQNDAMSADMSGSRICSTICALIRSAVHCVFVVGQNNPKLLNLLSHKYQPTIYMELRAACVHLYAKVGPQPLCMHECVREVEKCMV